MLQKLGKSSIQKSYNATDSPTHNRPATGMTTPSWTMRGSRRDSGHAQAGGCSPARAAQHTQHSGIQAVCLSSSLCIFVHYSNSYLFVLVCAGERVRCASPRPPSVGIRTTHNYAALQVKPTRRCGGGCRRRRQREPACGAIGIGGRRAAALRIRAAGSCRFVCRLDRPR